MFPCTHKWWMLTIIPSYHVCLYVLQLDTSWSGLKDESFTHALPHGMVMQVIVTWNYMNVNYYNVIVYMRLIWFLCGFYVALPPLSYDRKSAAVFCVAWFILQACSHLSHHLLSHKRYSQNRNCIICKPPQVTCYMQVTCTWPAKWLCKLPLKNNSRTVTLLLK